MLDDRALAHIERELQQIDHSNPFCNNNESNGI